MAFINSNPASLVRTYKGTQSAASADFQKDAAKLAEKGYVPTGQVWAPGTYGCGAFILATALCFILIGVIVFIYMIIVKPPGVLTVTYQRLQ